MGCCFSRTLDRGQPHIPDESHRPGKSPLRGSFDTQVENIPGNGTPDEETVKEVLSETPIAKPLQKTSPNFQDKKSPELKVKPIQLEEGVPSVSETSQVTEWCSNMSESVSMATTISEQREGDEASSKQSREIGRNTKPKIRRKRPYSGDPSYRREQRDKCATKRPELLPEKKSRVTCRYTQGTTESREARYRKLNGGHEQQSGVSHGRRSRSPAARTVRGTNKMGNVKSSAMKVTGRAGEQKETAVTTEKRDEGKVEKLLDGAIQPPNESIENPLVSLECFIFL